MTPATPRLRPGLAVFALDGDRVQIGLARPVILDGLSRDEAAFVAGLEGPPADHQVERAVNPTNAAALGHVLRTLDFHGLLRDSPTGEADRPVRTADDLAQLPNRHLRVSIIGAAALGKTIGMCLVQAGIDHIVFDDPTPLKPSDGSLSACATRGQAAAYAVNHWPSYTGSASSELTATAGVDVVVVIANGAVDATTLHDLMVADQPHLPVIGDECGITVGPLVVPGNGPCLNCLGIERAVREPQWPLVALQCGGERPIRATAGVSAIASGVACDLVTEFTRVGHLEASQWRVEHGTGGPLVTKRSVSAHPACGCAGAPARDDVGMRPQVELL